MEMMEHSLLFFLTLGVYHGINPGMGWLFSVSIAMQKESTQKIVKTPKNIYKTSSSVTLEVFSSSCFSKRWII